MKSLMIFQILNQLILSKTSKKVPSYDTTSKEGKDVEKSQYGYPQLHHVEKVMAYFSLITETKSKINALLKPVYYHWEVKKSKLINLLPFVSCKHPSPICLAHIIRLDILRSVFKQLAKRETSSRSPKKKKLIKFNIFSSSQVQVNL